MRYCGLCPLTAQCFYEERAAAVSPALGEHLLGLLTPKAAASDAVDVLAFCRAGLAAVSQLCHVR